MGSHKLQKAKLKRKNRRSTKKSKVGKSGKMATKEAENSYKEAKYAKKETEKYIKRHKAIAVKQWSQKEGLTYVGHH